MEKSIILTYNIDGKNLLGAGEASSNVKKALKQLGFSPEIIRRVAISMYEGEINMVIHASGGKADVEINPDFIKVILTDQGPGIKDINLAMQEGYSTASEQARQMGFGAGMGLSNMKSNTDKMDIKTKVGVGTTVELIIYTKI